MKEIVRFDLPSGIRCVHWRTASPVAYCGLTTGAGSRDETAREHGLAHLAEHSIFKGTSRRRAYHINNRLENLGGDLNAFTTKEETVVHAATLKRDFSKAAELISDIVFNSTYPQKEVDREKEIIIDEINSYKDAPVERIFDDFEERLFAGSSLGHNILGERRSIVKYTSDDIRAFTSRTWNTDLMVFSSAGRMSEGEFRRVCEKYFGDIPANHRACVRDGVPDTPVFDITLKKGSFQSHCIIGGRAYSSMDDRRGALSLLVNMLGGPSANSLLNVSVREKRGLSYNIEAGYSPLSDTGIATIYFSCERDNLPRCVELVHTELSKIVSGGITARQLSAAKKQFLGQYYISMESNEGHMLGAGKSILLYDRVEPVQNIVRRIEAISLDNVVEAARDIFAPEKLSTLIYK